MTTLELSVTLFAWKLRSLYLTQSIGGHEFPVLYRIGFRIFTVANCRGIMDARTPVFDGLAHVPMNFSVFSKKMGAVLKKRASK